MPGLCLRGNWIKGTSRPLTVGGVKLSFEQYQQYLDAVIEENSSYVMPQWQPLYWKYESGVINNKMLEAANRRLKKNAQKRALTKILAQ